MNRESSIKETYSISNREIVAVNVKFLNSCSVLIKADRVFVSPYCCFIYNSCLLIQQNITKKKKTLISAMVRKITRTNLKICILD